MYYSKDKTHRLTIRLDEVQYTDIIKYADAWNTTPSSFLRALLDKYRYERDRNNNENERTNINHQL